MPCLERFQKHFGRFLNQCCRNLAATIAESALAGGHATAGRGDAKQVGDPEHVKVFANVDAAEKWFEENDPEGVAFEYEVLE
jgi:hypothetical protein